MKPGLAVAAAVLAAVVVAERPCAATEPEAGGTEERLGRLEAELEQQRRETIARRGVRTFAQACAACHGALGRGNGPAAADLDPPPRNLTVEAFRFRTTPSGSPARLEDLERTIRRGLPGSSMPAFDGLLSDLEIAELIGFLDTLRPTAAGGEEPPPALAIPSISPPTPEATREGRALYVLLECWRCHGVHGSGRGPSTRGLTDDDGRPIRATDFRRDPFKGGREPADVVRSLRTGLNGTPMPSYDEALVFARESFGDPPALDERLPQGAVREVQEFLRSAPSQGELDRLGENGRSELRDRRLAALAHYVLSLDRRGSVASWLLHQRPEREARRR